MPKVKQIIELLDTDRAGNDVVFNYTTPELSDEDKAHPALIDECDLVRFIIDFELADNSDQAELLLHNAFEDVIGRFWDDILQPRLMSAYCEAQAYIGKVISKLNSPVSIERYQSVVRRAESIWDVKILREAA